MKAVQYFQKYRDRIVSRDEAETIKAIGDLVLELSEEAKKMIAARHVRTNSGAAAVLLELNQKYNAICNLFEKTYGASPLVNSGFLTYWRKQIPELERYL